MALAATSLDSQLGFTWQSPSPAQVAAISDCFIAQAGWLRTTHRWVGADLVLQPPGKPQSVCTQWTATDHVGEPPPCLPHPQLILHGGWRLVVSGHSQSLLLIGLGKSLPLTCQHQPRLNYKRRGYSAHTKGTL